MRWQGSLGIQKEREDPPMGGEGDGTPPAVTLQLIVINDRDVDEEGVIHLNQILAHTIDEEDSEDADVATKDAGEGREVDLHPIHPILLDPVPISEDDPITSEREATVLIDRKSPFGHQSRKSASSTLSTIYRPKTNSSDHPPAMEEEVKKAPYENGLIKKNQFEPHVPSVSIAFEPKVAESPNRGNEAEVQGGGLEKIIPPKPE